MLVDKMQETVKPVMRGRSMNYSARRLNRGVPRAKGAAPPSRPRAHTKI